MKVGIPKEIKNHEYRVAITPAGVMELVRNGHQVVVVTTDAVRAPAAYQVGGSACPRVRSSSRLQIRRCSARPKAPFVMRLLKWFPVLRRIPARIIGIGVRPEHIHTPERA